MDEKIIVMIKKDELDQGIDIEVPADISADEFIYGLNQSFHLGINMDDPTQCCLRSSNPVMLIRGEKTLKEHGLRNGSSIYLS